jgi:hypothetical protein
LSPARTRIAGLESAATWSIRATVACLGAKHIHQPPLYWSSMSSSSANSSAVGFRPAIASNIAMAPSFRFSSLGIRIRFGFSLPVFEVCYFPVTLLLRRHGYNGFEIRQIENTELAVVLGETYRLVVIIDHDGKIQVDHVVSLGISFRFLVVPSTKMDSLFFRQPLPMLLHVCVDRLDAHVPLYGTSMDALSHFADNRRIAGKTKRV